MQLLFEHNFHFNFILCTHRLMFSIYRMFFNLEKAWMVKCIPPQTITSWKKIYSEQNFLFLLHKGNFSPPPSPTPPLNAIWKILIRDISRIFFWNAVNYSRNGYMLNADGHLMDQFPGDFPCFRMVLNSLGIFSYFGINFS